ncbi:hypothetical protein CGC49_10540 [Capnocytophaga sp. H4358]|nr:hypothetical protein CGC49_10540 [Capnocytophaga sp. H4358]GIM60337.1 hypothetical protein CAPN008_03870 [Capnocytophaga canis]
MKFSSTDVTSLIKIEFSKVKRIYFPILLSKNLILMTKCATNNFRDSDLLYSSTFSTFVGDTTENVQLKL